VIASLVRVQAHGLVNGGHRVEVVPGLPVTIGLEEIELGFLRVVCQRDLASSINARSLLARALASARGLAAAGGALRSGRGLLLSQQR
jgi:hypothetical protein